MKSNKKLKKIQKEIESLSSLESKEHFDLYAKLSNRKLEHKRELEQMKIDSDNRIENQILSKKNKKIEEYNILLIKDIASQSFQFNELKIECLYDKYESDGFSFGNIIEPTVEDLIYENSFTDIDMTKNFDIKSYIKRPHRAYNHERINNFVNKILFQGKINDKVEFKSRATLGGLFCACGDFRFLLNVKEETLTIKLSEKIEYCEGYGEICEYGEYEIYFLFNLKNRV